MTMTESCKAINKAFTTLRNIDNANDLKKNRLSLSDYCAALDIFNELSTPGSSAKTFIPEVADFYKRCGFSVVLQGINYRISTEG